jgi:hypothetical protein
MTDNTQQPGAADTTEATEAQDMASLPAWAQKLIKDLRKEAGDYRTARKQADEAKRTAEEAALVEQAKWKELADKRGAELEGLKPVQDRLTAYETAFKTALVKRLDAIPDEFKSLVPAFDDPVKTWDWLDANQNLFARRIAPKLDAGAQGDAASKQTPKLTVEEIQIAKRSGLTPEQYAAQKVKIEASRSAQSQE